MFLEYYKKKLQENAIKFEPKTFIGGMFGGTIGVLSSHPFDTTRVVYQSSSKYKNLLECSKHILRTDGLRGFYRGIKPPLIGIGLEKCIVFGCYNNIKNNSPFKSEYGRIFTAGVFAGLCCTTVVTPVEKLKVMLQNKQNVTMKSIIRDYGIKGIYNGWTATLFREVPGFGIYFSTYEYLKKNTQDMKPYHSLFYGAASGLSAWLFIYPSDPVKTIMQNENKGFRYAVSNIYNTHGIRGFYRGFSLGLFRALPLHAGVFFGYELFMKYF